MSYLYHDGQESTQQISLGIPLKQMLRLVDIGKDD